jgi:hypothetical protein
MPHPESIATSARTRRSWSRFPALFLALFCPCAFAEEHDGFLHTEKGVRFPIGFYELPGRDHELKEMAASGINLVRCGTRADLDRCKEAGLLGWIPLPVDAGPTDALKARVLELRDHPALAVWEGPDEVVWNFTMFSGLAETANITREDWRFQRPSAVAYARKEAAKIMPRMNQAIKFVRENDPKHRPFWINEAGDSDVIYVRQYMDSIDATGCDFYPVKAERRELISIGKITDRWRMTGRDKPVWMVLQAFSWHKVRPEKYPDVAYPTFDETRFMAWDAIVHGARGIFYWGSQFIDDRGFLPSIYAMTAELAALEPFLIGTSPEDLQKIDRRAHADQKPPELPSVRLVEADLEGRTKLGVRMTFRQVGEEWLIALVNEDDIPHHGVEVRGLDFAGSPGGLEVREFHLLYGDETVKVSREGELMTRMQPYEVKLFATSRKWESARRTGRDYR